MPKRTIADSVKVIHDCAVQYAKNLAGKNVLFVTTHGGVFFSYETLFMPQNYLHLTGAISRISGELFYQAALNNRLSASDISLSSDGKTEQKLDVLPQLMNIHKSARMVGDYDHSRPLLVAEKYAGTVTMALGFVCVNDLYIPNTALKIDIRKITTQATRHRVVAIFVKVRNEALYKQLTYLAKGMTIDDDSIAPILLEKTDSSNLIADFPIPRKSTI